MRRGQIWWVHWEPGRGTEQHGRRPSLVIQNDAMNLADPFSLTVVVAISSSGLPDNLLHLAIEPSTLNGLANSSFVRCEQIMTMHKSRLDGHIGRLEPRYLEQVDRTIKMVLGLA